jgi:tetratricopeptide (TPR) repeat protein
VGDRGRAGAKSKPTVRVSWAYTKLAHSPAGEVKEITMTRKHKQRQEAKSAAAGKAWAALERGMACVREEDWAGAFAACSEAIGLYPEGAGKAMAHYFRGVARYHLGDMPWAIHDLTEAIAGAYLSADRAEAYAYRGLVCMKQGEYAGAIDDLTAAIDDFPDDHSDDDTGKADAYANRGLARHRSGDLSGALADYAEALTRNVSPGFVHYNAACTYSLLGDAGQACRWLAEAIDHDPALRDDAREDPDFYPLHREGCFQALIWG